MYAAKHYVRVNHTVLTAGEILPDGLPEEKIAWLLKAGAICEVPGTAKTETEETDCHTSAAAPVGIDTPSVTAESGGDTSLKEEGEREPEEIDEEAEPEEIDQETEPEEIDVMAGIVTKEPEEEPTVKPAKRGGRKSK